MGYKSGKYNKKSIRSGAVNFLLNSREPSREILVHLDYHEILKKLAIKRKKKVITKFENVYVNVIPYLEYTSKYEVKKQAQNRTFDILKEEGIYWLRIFSSEPLLVYELPKPYEKSIEYEWAKGSSGGSRFLSDSSSSWLNENAFWPLNPQFLLKFDGNISLKIILRKTRGHISSEENKIGLIVTKPKLGEYMAINTKNIKSNVNYTKNDQILR